MNSQPIGDMLKSLPPDLPARTDRFDQVRSRARRRRRLQVVGLASAIAGGGVAVTVLSTLGGGSAERGVDPAEPVPTQTDQVLPGAERVTPLSDPVVHEGDGTEIINLGAAPGRATALATELTCLTPGRIQWPDGSSVTCSPSDTDTGRPPGLLTIDLTSKPSEFVMTAKPRVRWRLVTYFVRTETTPWGVNAKGDTFGVENDSGQPDLIHVRATNGNFGYLYADELDSATGGDVSNPEEALEYMEHYPPEPALIDVFESDGETVIGQFKTG